MRLRATTQPPRRPRRAASSPAPPAAALPARAWFGCQPIRMATWNAHALDTQDAALRRRRQAAARRLAEAHDILFLQEVHGDEHSMAALVASYRVSHRMFCCPGPSPATGGCAPTLFMKCWKQATPTSFALR